MDSFALGVGIICAVAGFTAAKIYSSLVAHGAKFSRMQPVAVAEISDDDDDADAATGNDVSGEDTDDDAPQAALLEKMKADLLAPNVAVDDHTTTKERQPTTSVIDDEETILK